MDNLWELFISNIAKFREQEAIIFRKENAYHSLNYTELLNSAIYVCQLINETHQLDKAKGVFVFCEPSLVLPALLLGVLRSKRYFAWVDLSDPGKYITDFTTHFDVKYAIGTKETLNNIVLPFKYTELNETDTLIGNLVLLELLFDNSNCQVGPQRCEQFELAYCVLSSGSTGKSKVIQVPHKSIHINITELRKLFEVVPTDIIPLLSPLTFDPSIIELFLALSAKAKLLIIDQKTKIVPTKLLNLLTEAQVTVIQACPSLILRFGQDAIERTLLSASSQLRVLAFGGELCPNLCLIRSWRGIGNSTAFYNLYGTTEVSCWATCERIDLSSNIDDVALGEPLLETLIELRDERGSPIILEGVEGEIFIGSSTRICFVSGDPISNPSSCVWRATGDLATKLNGKIYYKHRTDAIIKHNGKKLSLNLINNLVLKHKSVNSAFTLYDTEKKIVKIFLVPQQQDLKEIRMELIKNIRKSHLCLAPVEFLFIPELPVTKHGKIDNKLLLKISEKKHDGLTTDPLMLSVTDTMLHLLKIYSSAPDMDLSKNFIELGFNSIEAVQFSMDLETQLNSPFPQLIDLLLHNTIEEVITYINNSVLRLPKEVKSKFSCDKIPAIASANVSSIVLKKPAVAKSFEVYGRTNLNCICDNCKFKQSNDNGIEENQLNYFKVRWKYDLEKCLDSTPLIINYQKGDTVVFIGSHSGKFVALDFNTGQLFWSLQLNNRIESSACACRHGNSVFFGCYNNCLYAVDVSSGEVKWELDTGGIVKSSPVADMHHDLLYCGSHSKLFFIINSISGEILNSIQISNSSIFASAAVLATPHLVYTATLDGCLAAIKPIEAKIMWKVKLGKPLFSSPCVTAKGVAIGCVNNCLYFYSHQRILLWSFQSDGPIFSSPSIMDGFVFFGSHDHHVYCLCSETGILRWKVKLGQPVYASPVTFRWKKKLCLCVASTNGNLQILCAEEGKLIEQIAMCGEIFSSPVFFLGQIVIGSRDNYVYTLLL